MALCLFIMYSRMSSLGSAVQVSSAVAVQSDYSDQGANILLYSFGVFQEWYLTHPPFESASEASINAIGTTTLAIQYMEGIILVALAQRYPAWVRPAMWIGLLVCVGSLALASFANQVDRSRFISYSFALTLHIFPGLAAGSASRRDLRYRRRRSLCTSHSLGNYLNVLQVGPHVLML